MKSTPSNLCPCVRRRFLPSFKKKNVKRKKPLQAQKLAAAAAGGEEGNAPASAGKLPKKKEYTPFPPQQPLSKIDKQIESGEYFLSEEQKRARATAAQEAKQAKKVEERAKQRQAAFVAPKVWAIRSQSLIIGQWMDP